MTNTEIERLMIARVINAHDDKEPYCEMYDTDIEYLVRFSEHLVIKTFVMEEDEYSNHDYVALEPAIGLKVKIKRGHVRKLKALHASMYL